MNRCIDYPCCGHTDGLPCDWTPPDYRDPAVAAAYHIGCDHNAGYCEYEQDDDEDYDDDSYDEADAREDDPDFGYDWRDYYTEDEGATLHLSEEDA